MNGHTLGFCQLSFQTSLILAFFLLKIKGCLESPIEGVVLVTYGSGNIPHSRTDLVEAIKVAAERGVVIVTCCPCRGGPHDVSTEYVEQVGARLSSGSFALLSV